MIHVIESTNELPKGMLYHQTHERPPDNVTAYEFTNWLQTVWFVVVDKPFQPLPVDYGDLRCKCKLEPKEYNGEGVA